MDNRDLREKRTTAIKIDEKNKQGIKGQSRKRGRGEITIGSDVGEVAHSDTEV